MARSKHTRAQESRHAQRVRELHAMVREARALLTNPTQESLDACLLRLQEAAAGLSQLHSSLPSGDLAQDRALNAPLGALRSEIAGVQILLDGAAAFYTGWMRLASSKLSGYTAGGSAASTQTQRRVLVEA